MILVNTLTDVREFKKKEKMKKMGPSDYIWRNTEINCTRFEDKCLFRRCAIYSIPNMHDNWKSIFSGSMHY